MESTDFLDVRDFHQKFGQPIDAEGTAVRLMTEDQFTFRIKFLREELDEYGVAFNQGNLIKAADALFDFVYVIFGTALYMGAGPRYFDFMLARSWPTFPSVRGSGTMLGLLPYLAAAPTLLPDPMHALMHKRMTYELDLFEVAHSKTANTAFAISTLWNLAYAAYMTAALMGVPWEKCWRHVQVANMAKINAKADGSDSTRGSSMDVVKPIGWCAPDEKIAMELVLAGASIEGDHLAAAKRASQPKQ